MARPTKYTPENIEIILQAIRDSGIEAKGYRAANLSEDQYHTWKKTKAEFSELVSIALEDFRRSHQHELNLAHAYLLRCLAGTEKLRTTKIQIKRDSQGNVLEEITSAEEKDVKPPDWLISKLHQHLRADQQQEFIFRLEVSQPPEQEPEEGDEDL
jgi:hypothetical protein